MPATPERGREGEGAPLGLAEEGREGEGRRRRGVEKEQTGKSEL